VARSTLTIRDARSDDLPRLLDLLEELREGATSGVPWDRATDDFTNRVWNEILADPRRRFLIAEDGGTVVGTADVIVVPNLTHAARPIAFVENVVVTAKRRGHGIGRELMEEVLRRAELAGCYKVQFLSNRTRTRAHAFYERLGFEPSSEGFRRYLPQGG
jgi:N-acetylglutamate synthase-like GNAT family acetyltransferase